MIVRRAVTALAAVMLVAGCAPSPVTSPPASGAVPIPTTTPAKAWSIGVDKVGDPGKNHDLGGIDLGTQVPGTVFVRAVGLDGIVVTAIRASDGSVVWQKQDPNWNACVAVSGTPTIACLTDSVITTLSGVDGSTIQTITSPVTPLADAIVQGDGAIVLSYPRDAAAPSTFSIAKVNAAGVAWRHDESIVPGDTNVPSLTASTTLINTHTVATDNSPLVYLASDGSPWKVAQQGTPTLLPNGDVSLSGLDGTSTLQPDGTLIMTEFGDARAPETTDRSAADLPLFFYEEFGGTSGLASYSAKGAASWQVATWNNIASYCGGLLVVTDGSNVGALDPATGKQIWKKPITIADGRGIDCDGVHAVVQTGAAGDANEKVEWLNMTDGASQFTVQPAQGNWISGLTSAGLVVMDGDTITLYR